MAHIREVMTRNPVTLMASMTVSEAARRMKEANIGDVIVLREGDEMCGILTDRDIVVRAIAEGKDPNQVKLDDICSHELTTVSPDDDVDKAVQLMREKAIRRLPVTENGKAVGIVSLGDLAKERDRHSVLGEISAKPPNQ